MPRYLYQCPCGHQIERTTSIAERDDQYCTEERSDCPCKNQAERKMTREEIPAGTQRMSYNWSKWSL